jgi:hypothetical protein
VRHVYKVLLTRGLVGCGLFSVDAETNAFLTSLVTSSEQVSEEMASVS